MHTVNRLFIIKNATHYEVLKIFLNQNSISVNYVILTLDRLVGNAQIIAAARQQIQQANQSTVFSPTKNG